MAQINDTLLSHQPSQQEKRTNNLRSFAISGLGGMGKTQIALEYTFSSRPKLQAILWIQANNRTNLAESFLAVAIGLGIANASEVTDLVLNWLLIFNNADDMELINDFWASMANGAILLTSRDPVAIDFCSKSGLQFTPMDLFTAAKLFCEILYGDSQRLQRGETMVLQLERCLGGVHLAIVQPASLIQRRNLSFGEFSRNLERNLIEAGLGGFQALQTDSAYH